MGFFDKPSAASAGLAPLARKRLEEALERQELRYMVDGDEIVVGFDGGYFVLIQLGAEQEILMVRGIWDGTLPKSEMGRALEFCAERNNERIWPKAYPYPVPDEDAIRMMGEVAVDYQHGLTDAQLDLHLACAFQTNFAFFESLVETFPQYAPRETE